MLYIHIPFCKQKCSYCNFHFSTQFHTKKEMVDAIKKEINIRHHELIDSTIHTIYFGGGTPSLLGYEDLQRIIDEILIYFQLSKDVEITLEANPDDLDKKFLQQLQNSPINRLSIGIQSFNDKELKLMNRAHNAQQAETAVKRSQDFGFENLNADLIYGSPISNGQIWKENLQKIVDFKIPHISAYALTIEPKTILEKWIENKKIMPPNEDFQQESFQIMIDFLKENHFEHYEISNFSLPGFHSRHNVSYWQQKPYLGIGPSAHSFDGKTTRSWNVSNNSVYINQINQNKIPQEIELLSEKDLYNEWVMIGLRTQWGIELEKLENNFQPNIQNYFHKKIEKKIHSGFLIKEKNIIKIPEKHWFLADGIAADLFI